MYQAALLCMLHSAYHGEFGTKSDFDAKVEPLVGPSLQLMRSLASSPVCSTLLWPVLITGSCIAPPQQRIAMDKWLRASPFRMPIVDRARAVLDVAWKATNETLFGVLALDRALETIDFCMS